MDLLNKYSRFMRNSGPARVLVPETAVDRVSELYAELFFLFGTEPLEVVEIGSFQIVNGHLLRSFHQ